MNLLKRITDKPSRNSPQPLKQPQPQTESVKSILEILKKQK